MAGAKIPKLQTNIPRCGRIKAVYYAKSQNPEYGDQIKIVGTWENEGEGPFWLALPVIKAFTDAGLVAQVVGQVDNDGYAKFHVVSTQQRVMIVKKEDGKKKVHEVHAINDAGQVVQLPAQPYPDVLNQPTPAATAVAPAAPAAPAAPGAVAPPAPGAVAPAAPAVGPIASDPRITTGAALQDKLTPEEKKQRAQKGWADLEERYGCALAISAFCQLKLARAKDPALEIGDLSATVIQAGAATILIESSKTMVPVIPGLAKALFERLTHGVENGKKPADRGVATTSQAIAAGTPAKQGDFDDFDETTGPDQEDDDLPF